MDITNSLNFYVGRPADVADMLLHRQIVSERYAQISCLQENRISVSLIDHSHERKF